jgi:spore coat polysaccharide biosynthesis protein SpsF (cytidylyltransferase family)
MKRKTVAFIQARMSSSRFPGKVLESLGGLPMIVFMWNRAHRATTLDDVVVVTSTDSSDDPLADVLRLHRIPCFRGELHDVLGRYGAAAAEHRATEVVRLTGDCPLIDPSIIDRVLHARREADADYASNVVPPTFPDGLDVECCKREVLDRAVQEAREAPEREHVTLWMRNEKLGFNRVNVKSVVDCSALRLTVDYPDDLQAVRQLVALVERPPDQFDLFDMLRVLASAPEILNMNSHARNEGLAKSIETLPQALLGK